MSYAELLQALELEVARQSAALGGEAERERDRLLEEARAQAAAERKAALSRLARARESGRALAGLRRLLEDERALLAERRRLLESLAAEAGARLRALRRPELLARLADETLAEARQEPGAIVLRAPAEAAETLRAHLARAWPDLAGRVTIEPLAPDRAGVEAEVGGIVFDDTLQARAARAWPSLEPRVAALLFGEEPDDHGVA